MYQEEEESVSSWGASEEADSAENSKGSEASLSDCSSSDEELESSEEEQTTDSDAEESEDKGVAQTCEKWALPSATSAYVIFPYKAKSPAEISLKPGTASPSFIYS